MEGSQWFIRPRSRKERCAEWNSLHTVEVTSWLFRWQWLWYWWACIFECSKASQYHNRELKWWDYEWWWSRIKNYSKVFLEFSKSNDQCKNQWNDDCWCSTRINEIKVFWIAVKDFHFCPKVIQQIVFQIEMKVFVCDCCIYQCNRLHPSTAHHYTLSTEHFHFFPFEKPLKAIFVSKNTLLFASSARRKSKLSYFLQQDLEII